jgi:type 1 fimbriae regulatory protein FimB
MKVKNQLQPFKSLRKYLTEGEIKRMMLATQAGRNPERDYLLILLSFRHGLRVSEACSIQLEQLDLESAVMYVNRLKRGLSTVHPLQPDEVEAITRWLEVRSKLAPSNPYLFVTQRGSIMSRQTVHHLMRRYGELAGLGVRSHPHMLRHACGFALADQGLDTRLIQDYLGHRNIQHTVLYTAANAARFKRVWQGE